MVFWGLSITNETNTGEPISSRRVVDRIDFSEQTQNLVVINVTETILFVLAHPTLLWFSMTDWTLPKTEIPKQH